MARRNKRRLHEFRIPEESKRILQTDILRLNSNHEWKNRTLILTKEELLVTSEQYDFVLEKIPLVQLDSSHS